MNRRMTALAGVCVIAASAWAAVLVAGRGGGASIRPVTGAAELDRIGGQAMRLVTFDAGRVGYTIRFQPGRDGVRARTDRMARTISVFLRHGDAPHVVGHDIAHELGHAYDDVRMDDGARRAYLARRGVPAAPWLPAGDSDYGVGAGDFAEVFALCHSASPDFRGELAPRPANACELLPAGAL